MVKGMKVNVSVNVSIKAEDIKIDDFCKTIDREKRDNNYFKNIDLEVGASIGMGIEEMEGDIDLRELGDLINKSLSEEIGRQVREQIEEKRDSSSEPEQKEDDTEEK